MSDARHNSIVLKFGGTSVSTSAEWDTIAGLVRERLGEGLTPFVVCSAVSGVSRALKRMLEAAIQDEHEPVLKEIRARHRTLADSLGVDGDALLGEAFDELARLATGASLTQEISPHLEARVLGMGELMSTRLGAAYLQQQGLDVQWRDARQMLHAVTEPRMLESQRYLSAICHHEPDADLQAQLRQADADLFLTQGFIASDERGDTVLLGWGGSDTSAAYFAAKLQARRLEIWTDVPGMFTANPRQIPSARLLRQLDYAEAQELATTGAKVLHPRSLDPVRRQRIPLHVRATQAPDLTGTVIAGDAPSFGAQVKGISSKDGLTLISMETLGMWQEVGFLADAFAVFKDYNLSVDLVATSETNVTVSLDPTANDPDPAILEVLLADLNAFCKAKKIGPSAAVSLVGHNIRSILHELGPALEVFDDQHIHLVTQAANDLNLSFVVDEEQTDRLVRQLHAQLFDTRGEDQLFGPTWRELFEEPVGDGGAVESDWWHARRSELLSLAEETAPLFVYDEQTLRSSVEAVQSIEAVDGLFYAMKANAHPEVLRRFYAAGLGFECVSPGEIEHVCTLFPEIDPERILFTPNFAPREEYAFGLEAAGFVTLDSLHPLEAWSGLFEGQDVILRVDPGRGHGHHKHVRTAGAQSKFGIAPPDLDRCAELVEAASARVIGLHAHLGSGIKLAEAWMETAVFLIEEAERFPDVRFLNLGGGLGVPERPGAARLDLGALDEHLQSFKEAHPDVALWLEPGRYLVAHAGVLLARVTQTKQKDAVRYVGLETGMNSLIRPALYGAYHDIHNLTRLGEPPSMQAEVVGPICETGDVLGHSRRLPETEEGDVLLIATAGAYGHAMSSNYNLRPPAAEVLLEAEAVGV